MIGLSKIYQFDQHVAVYHYIVRFQVQMHDFIVPDVPQSLNDREDKVKLGDKRDRMRIISHVLLKIAERDIIHHYRVLIGVRLICNYVVFR